MPLKVSGKQTTQPARYYSTQTAVIHCVDTDILLIMWMLYVSTFFLSSSSDSTF